MIKMHCSDIIMMMITIIIINILIIIITISSSSPLLSLLKIHVAKNRVKSLHKRLIKAAVKRKICAK